MGAKKKPRTWNFPATPPGEDMWGWAKRNNDGTQWDVSLTPYRDAPDTGSLRSKPPWHRLRIRMIGEQYFRAAYMGFRREPSSGVPMLPACSREKLDFVSYTGTHGVYVLCINTPPKMALQGVLSSRVGIMLWRTAMRSGPVHLPDLPGKPDASDDL